MIETHELTRRFGATLAVDRVTTTVASHGLVGFLGPNGAGKTTTMRMLTGFLPPSSGTARIAGYDVYDEPHQVKARVGYLPETPPLYPELTVGEYLSFVAEIRGVSRAERPRRIGTVLEQTGLVGWERRRLASLSKGYRQRVGLAQAIVHDPRVLILDEPTSGLDPAQVVAVRALIRELAQQRTVVLSTHVLAEVEALCDRILLVHRGALVGDGTVDELAEKIGQGPWVELAVDGTGRDLRAPLAALPEVGAVERLAPEEGAALDRYKLRGGAALEPAVAALAQREGCAVRRLVRHRASLETVFLALIAETA
jgi:ABC-2 type transport system ATP-binding protein